MQRPQERERVQDVGIGIGIGSWSDNGENWCGGTASRVGWCLCTLVGAHGIAVLGQSPEQLGAAQPAHNKARRVGHRQAVQPFLRGSPGGAAQQAPSGLQLCHAAHACPQLDGTAA